MNDLVLFYSASFRRFYVKKILKHKIYTCTYFVWFPLKQLFQQKQKEQPHNVVDYF